MEFETKVPGVLAAHQKITPACVATHGEAESLQLALAPLVKEYLAGMEFRRNSGELNVAYHVTLSVETL